MSRPIITALTVIIFIYEEDLDYAVKVLDEMNYLLIDKPRYEFENRIRFSYGKHRGYLQVGMPAELYLYFSKELFRNMDGN